jgi:DedD protein
MADLPDDSFNLKHRLVGAMILILAAVVFLPRVLTGTDTSPATSNGNNLSGALQVEPQVFSELGLPDSGTTEVSDNTRIEILSQNPAPNTDVGAGNSQLSGPAESDSGTERIAAISLSSAPPDSESIVTGWIVQVGIFQQPDNAKKLIDDLKADGINAKGELIDMDDRQAARIWLGPFSTRSEAIREGNKAMMRTNSKPIVKEWP